MMNILELHIKNKDFRHGYLLAGDCDSSREEAFKAASVIFSGEGNVLDRLETHPDFFYQKFDSFGVKDSHNLRQKAALKSFLGSKKVFVLEIAQFGIESSNALLKLFEEPQEGTFFFVIVPFLEDVLPTLRSRLMIVNNFKRAEEFDKEKKEFYKKFLDSLPGKRLELIKNISQDKDKEKTILFLNEIEVMINGIAANNLEEKIKIQALEEIHKCRDFVYQKGGSAKMVLEYLALSLPKII